MRAVANSALEQSSAAYKRSAEELDDQLMRDHKEAMFCRNLEDAIETGMALFVTYSRLDAKWRDELLRDQAALHRDQTALERGEMLKAISDLLSIARDRVLHAITLMKEKGYSVDCATAFRQATFVPFDQRPLEVPFTEQDFRAIQESSDPSFSDTVCDEDDDL